MQAVDEEEVLTVKIAVTAATHDLRPLATAAAIVTVILGLAVSSILMSLPAHTEAVVQLGPLPTLALVAELLPVRVLAHPLDAMAMVGAGHPTADLDLDPGPAPPTAAAGKTGDAIRAMVIITDPNSAVNHPAHILPDEAEPERIPSPEA